MMRIRERGAFLTGWKGTPESLGEFLPRGGGEGAIDRPSRCQIHANRLTLLEFSNISVNNMISGFKSQIDAYLEFLIAIKATNYQGGSSKAFCLKTIY
ncbi:MAG: hypothetical protein ACE5R6_19860 [Candidatus Heimdallarchaeota archaeon]